MEVKEAGNICAGIYRYQTSRCRLCFWEWHLDEYVNTLPTVAEKCKTNHDSENKQQIINAKKKKKNI